MSTIRSGDEFLVQRGTDSFRQTSADLMSTIRDGDWMLVQRGANSYKVSGADVRSQLGGSGGGGIGGGSDEIDEITLTVSNEQATWTAFSGTYGYQSTTLYVSQSNDFTNLNDGYTHTTTDNTELSAFITGLGYNVTYYATVAHTDQAGNRRFSDIVTFTSADIPDFAEYILTQSFGAINLSSYPQGARISIAYMESGHTGQTADGGWDGSERWNGNAGNGGASGGFRHYAGTVADMAGVPISDIANDGSGVTNLGHAGGGGGGKIYTHGDDANGKEGGTLPTGQWSILNEFNGYRFEAGNKGSRGIATSPPSGGGNGGGGGGGGLRLYTEGGYDGENSQPSVPSQPNGEDGRDGIHHQGNGGGGEGFGAGGGGAGSGNGGGGEGKPGNGAAGIALIKVWYRRDSLLTPGDRYVPANPQEDPEAFKVGAPKGSKRRRKKS